MRCLTLLFAASSACSVTVDGEPGATAYGEVALTVTVHDGDGNQTSHDLRRGAGEELVAPLDRDLYDPIIVDGDEVSDPSLLLAADQATISLPAGGEVHLRRSGSRLEATGSSPLDVRAAWREGATLAVEVDGGRFGIELTGAVTDGSVDRFLATALVRLVRGEALLADDCRPDCIYSFGVRDFLCEPVRDLAENLLGGECAGPISSDEWAAIETYYRNDGRRDTCYDIWYVPRPICEYMYDRVVDRLFTHVAPDQAGNLCSDSFYQACVAD